MDRQQNQECRFMMRPRCQQCPADACHTAVGTRFGAYFRDFDVVRFDAKGVASPEWLTAGISPFKVEHYWTYLAVNCMLVKYILKS